MAHFTYKIRTLEGKLQKGIVVAIDQRAAMQKVRELGGVVLQLENEASPKKGGFHFTLNRGLSLKDRIVFTEQLAVMLKAGITLVQALKGLGEESDNKVLVGIISTLVADIEGGKPFSSALAAHPKVFSTIYREMIHSAEKSGDVAEVLEKLTSQQQKEFDLRGKVKGALIYPAIVSTLLIAVIIMVITFILPKLTGLFTDSHVALPLSTRMLMGLSHFFTTDWLFLIIGLLMLVGGLKLAMRYRKGRRLWDLIKIRMPILGPFMRKSYMARFTESFASLAQAGIPVLDIFNTLKGVMGNCIYEEEIAKIAADVENGIKVSTAIRKSKYFPAMVGQLVSVGEQSGDLAGIFNVLGEFFEKEVDTMARNLSTILEPVIMIVMGVVIGFVLVSVLQPIYGLVNAV